MFAYLIKAYMSIAEFVGRVLFINRKFPKGITVLEDLHYSKKGILDLFIPDKSKGSLPVLIYIHGGGWVSGSKRTCRRICAVFSREGYVVLNLKYRLSPKFRHPAALMDISDAINWLNNNADRFKADTSRVFFGGSSAGAHLAAMTACIVTNENIERLTRVNLKMDKSQLKGVVLVYGGYNMKSIVDSGFFMIKTMVRAYTGKVKKDDELFDQISPINHITSEFPPAFITAGERDHLYWQSWSIQ